MRAVCACERLNARSVGSPRTTSRKWLREQRERLPALARAVLRVAPDEPHEDRDERKRQQHDAGREEVDRRDERENGDGHDEREDDLREVAGERRLERLDARDRGGRDLGALRAVERRRRDGAASSRRRRAEAARSRRRPRASRRPRSPTPRARARRRPRRAARGASRPRRATRPRTRAPRRAPGAPPGRGRAAPSTNAEHRVGDEQHPRRPRAAEEARIEEPHPLLTPRRLTRPSRDASRSSRSRGTRTRRTSTPSSAGVDGRGLLRA